ncbi:hypothetical protein CCO03_16330 [Comamonas serinivorans]|uniref:Glycosyltransferase RgtA/B/C/D-like domain-containing protein n=1 Tax=Comamonas serinivorans TaxID=1082851 RepID=A0A1Y0EQU5_9BURK|nr:hypothetical protein CCO03_16330 [Comamonas serinivorans]
MGALSIVLWVAVQRLIPAFAPQGQLNSDAQWSYLPSARELLANPWAFLTTNPSSYHVAPLGYVWPAVWQADQLAIQFANCGLFFLSIGLLWLLMQKLGGVLAAFITTGLLVIHPGVVENIPQVLTEAPYLFGMVLALFGAVHALIYPSRRTRWLAVMALGLCLTLLTRPVFQYLMLATCLLAIGSWLSKVKGIAPRSAKHLAIALLAASVLPLGVVLKNGVYFDVWSISTGSGTGLYYGTSPYRQGAEPVYSNFSYDADEIPRQHIPDLGGNPLDHRSDAINRMLAIELIKSTAPSDNLRFFGHKLHMWLLTATPELYINFKLRWLRWVEWLSVGALLVLSAVRWWRVRKTISGAITLPGTQQLSVRQKMGVVVALLALCLTMAVQLTPVLYNTRYASYFMEPWLMMLAGLSVAYIVCGRSLPALLTWVSTLGKLALIGLIVWVAYALTQHAVRREVWEMDPQRPGPTAVVIPADHLREVHTEGLQWTDQAWQVVATPATLHINLPLTSELNHVKDAMWRMQFALYPPGGASPASCDKATLVVEPHEADINAYTPPAQVFTRPDGHMHVHMVSANGRLRPKGKAQMVLTFHCPIGTRLDWEGLELRRSALSEAVQRFLHEGVPIDPYLHTPLR